MLSPRAEYEAQCHQIEEELVQTAPEPLRSRLIQLIRPSIILSTSPSNGELPPLASKLGGSPDVPIRFEWPYYGGESLGFVAQLNLEELIPFDLENRLPKSGLLSFWTNGAWGGANEFGSWRVFHFQGENWQRLEKPKRTGFKKWRLTRDALSFRPAPIEPEIWASLANVWGGMEFRDEKLSPPLPDAISVSIGGGYCHQMFGFPNSVQNDVREECASHWNSFLALPEAKQLGLSALQDEATWQDFELLLQIQDDVNAKMIWGDAGAIYFLIRKADLAAGRFDRCWFSLQSC